jgi:tripartite-type tricarboxylate transporter receptor subunit TctC
MCCYQSFPADFPATIQEDLMKNLSASLLRSLAMTTTMVLCALPQWADAQAYPAKPIRFIVPFQAGSAPDAIARVVAQHMQQTLGQTITVDNKPGASGAIGAIEAAKAAPDGYTIFGGSNTILAANPSLFKKLPYNPSKDFVPVGRFITASLTLVVKPDFPAQTVRELVAHLKSKKGELNAGYASAGMQVSLAELKHLAGVDFLEVSYKGAPQAVTDLLGGQIAFTFSDNAVAATQIKAGRVKGLAITAPVRSALMPAIPTMAEELPGFDVTIWNGLSAPAGTPKAVVDKLWSAIAKALVDSEVVSRLTALGLEPAPMGPEEYGRFITAETAKWARQIKTAGIQPE